MLIHQCPLDIPKLMQLLPGNASKDQGEFKQGTVLNPFDAPDPSRAAVREGWIIDSASKMRFDNIFFGQQPQNGKISGARARDYLMGTGVPSDMLRKIWGLSDIDKDGALDASEFAVTMYLVESALANRPLPAKLPMTLCPPEKRHLVQFS